MRVGPKSHAWCPYKEDLEMGVHSGKKVMSRWK